MCIFFIWLEWISVHILFNIYQTLNTWVYNLRVCDTIYLRQTLILPVVLFCLPCKYDTVQPMCPFHWSHLGFYFMWCFSKFLEVYFSHPFLPNSRVSVFEPDKFILSLLRKLLYSSYVLYHHKSIAFWWGNLVWMQNQGCNTIHLTKFYYCFLCKANFDLFSTHRDLLREKPHWLDHSLSESFCITQHCFSFLVSSVRRRVW